MPSLRFGFSYRAELALHVKIPATVELADIRTLSLTIDGINHLTPHTFNLGAAWDITDNFTLSLDGSYEMWSRAPSPYIDIDIDISGDLLKALGLDTALDAK